MSIGGFGNYNESGAGHEPSRLRDGLRAAAPVIVPTFALGISFGVLAEPVMGQLAPVVMSIVVFAGSAQFAALSVLAAGGGAGPAIVSGLLMNARFLPMGFAVGASLPGGALARGAQGQAVVDASFVLANRGGGRFDRNLLFGATVAQGAAWIVGTVVGVVGGGAIAEPERFGLDAIFPAFYLALLAEEVGSRYAVAAAALGAVIAIALIPLTPPGIPVIAASVAALLGLRRP
jgi:4-azaleucine resistance transporter AzlC